MAKEIERGSVFVNAARVEAPNTRVRGGDIVRFDGRGYAEPEVDDRISVLYEDEHLLCVDKPGTCPFTPRGGISTIRWYAFWRRGTAAHISPPTGSTARLRV